MRLQLTAKDLDKPLFVLTAEMAIIAAYKGMTSNHRIINSTYGEIIHIAHDYGEFTMAHEEFTQALAKLRVMGKI